MALNVTLEKLSNGNYKLIRYSSKEKIDIKYIEYYNSKDEYHRKDGPARIFYHRSGEINRELYYINGKRNRLNGPARIWYRENGEIEGEDYFVNGMLYSKEEFYKRPEVIKFRNINRNLKLLNKV